jgi:hypothetical protein
VVPAQRPPAAETQPIPRTEAKPSGQIGGRAMLAPGESLSGHLAKLKTGGRRRAKESPESLTQTMPSAHQGSNTTAVVPPREAWNGARAASDPMPGTVVHSPAAKRRAMIDNATRTARETGDKLVTTVRGWSRNQQLIAGGGALAVVVLLVLVFSLTGDGDDNTPPAANQQPTTAPVAASFPTQTYSERGINVDVPQGWARKASGVWVDYIDPDDKLRKVRILVESSKATPEKFLSVAENGLENRSTSCPKPYARVNLTQQSIAGRDGAVLEYTCGTGPEARHGMWGAVIENGKAYSFYLTTSEAKFADSKQIFDEMAKTYKLS